MYLATGSRSVVEYQQGVGAWSGATGQMLDGLPRQIEDVQFLAAPAIGDITGDGMPKPLWYRLATWFMRDVEGNEAVGLPKMTGNWILGSPTGRYRW